MSLSPPIRRLSVSSTKREEDLINAYEAEEERLINLLSRKLEKLREEKVALENIREVESESQVNRLTRELSALRLAQQQQHQNHSAQENGSGSTEPAENRAGMQAFMSSFDPLAPSTEVIMDALRKENEQLRGRLAQAEREYIRMSRLNDIYREELIDHRRRLGLPVDNLIGLSTMDPYSQPIHLRTYSQSSSPSTSMMLLPPAQPPREPPAGVPIPRPPSQIRRPVNNIPSETTTPLSRSPSSADSPFPLSPVTSTNPASFLTNETSITTPPSSASLTSNPPAPYPASHTLSYPSVPPPSLSSSYGSPVISYHTSQRDPSLSPIESRSRRNSYQRRGSFERRPGHAAGDSAGSLRSISRSHSRRESVERGVRVAETGTLIPRSRTNSVASPMQQAAGGDDISRQETIPELPSNL